MQHGLRLSALFVLFFAAPRVVLALDPPLHAREIGHWDGHPGRYADVWGEGDFAYLVNWGAIDRLAARVYVIDISNPASPTLDETLLIPAPNEGASGQDVKTGDGLLFVGLDDDPNDGAAVYDISDPADRRFLTWVTVPGFEQIHNLYYDAGFLYLPSGTSVAIIDLRDLDRVNPPTSITQALWTLDNVGTSFTHDVTVRDGRLFVAAWGSGLWLYDASDVGNTKPTLLASIAGQATHSTWPTEDGRFVVTGEERLGGGIHVFEIVVDGGATQLVLRDSMNISVWATHNQMSNGLRVFNSWHEIGLQVFDISPIDGTLEHVASFDTSESGRGNFGVYSRLGDDRILLSDTEDGLFIVEVDESIVAPSPPARVPVLGPGIVVALGLALGLAARWRLRAGAAPEHALNSGRRRDRLDR